LPTRKPQKRGIALSFASALMQALGRGSDCRHLRLAAHATAKTMCGAERAIEIASYALIAAFGARLSGQGRRIFFARCRRRIRCRDGGFTSSSS